VKLRVCRGWRSRRIRYCHWRACKLRFEYGKKDGKLTTKAKSETTPVRERGWGCAANESDGSACQKCNKPWKVARKLCPMLRDHRQNFNDDDIHRTM